MINNNYRISLLHEPPLFCLRGSPMSLQHTEMKDRDYMIYYNRNIEYMQYIIHNTHIKYRIRSNGAGCVNLECHSCQASSPTEPPWMFTHKRHSNDRGGESRSVWPLPSAIGPLCTHYRADLVNWTNHLWLSTDSGLVIQQRQRSFFIMRYDIAAWIAEAVCRGSACACT